MLQAVFLRVHAVVGRLSVLYYKGVFIASISDAVSSHPVSPGLCTHTEAEQQSKEGKEGIGQTGVEGGVEERKDGVKSR